MIHQDGDNKIKIPWYRRNVRLSKIEDNGVDPLSFNLPPSVPNTPRVRQPQGVRQPSTQPATEPARQPVRVPNAQPAPSPNPFPVPEGGWQPNPFPEFPFPLPLPNPNPKPEGERQPAPQQPAFPAFPAWTIDPNYDWEAHWKRVAESLPKSEPVPEPAKKNPAQQALENILKPIVWLFVANEVKNQWIEVNITDPIYQSMLNDPVLGLALREAEKANLDAEAVGTYFANYDWDNMDIDQITRDLTVIVGAAGAARIIVFLIGRKVVFRI